MAQNSLASRKVLRRVRTAAWPRICRVAFSVPAKPSASAAGIPLMGLNPQVSNTGGTLAGGQTLYYGISAVDANGAEGRLSFIAVANVPAGDNTNQVTLVSLSFSPAAVSFNVYRGLKSYADSCASQVDVAIASQFVDSGLTALLEGPPDPNYDHANFYWRLEFQPPEQGNISSLATIGNSALNMVPNLYNGATVRISTGTGAGQERTIASNTASTLTVTTQWSVQPDTTSYFLIADSTWQFGASSNASPVSFAVPNREGVTIDISGRAANVVDEECCLRTVSADSVDDSGRDRPSFRHRCSGTAHLRPLSNRSGRH